MTPTVLVNIVVLVISVLLWSVIDHNFNYNRNQNLYDRNCNRCFNHELP